GGGVDLHVDARVLRREIRESRQEPLREEGGDGRHAQGPGAAIGPRLVDRTLEIGERRLDLRPQQRALRRQLDLAPIAARGRNASMLAEPPLDCGSYARDAGPPRLRRPSTGA